MPDATGRAQTMPTLVPMFPEISRSHAEADYVALANQPRNHRLEREDASIGPKDTRSILDRLASQGRIDLGESAGRDNFERCRHCLAPMTEKTPFGPALCSPDCLQGRVKLADLSARIAANFAARLHGAA